MLRSPAARASAARDNLSYCDIYRPGSVAQIRATIPEDSLDVLDNAPGASWLEFEHDRWLMDGVIAQFGCDEAVKCWRQSIGHLVDKPLLKNFVQGGLRLFGAKPASLLKLIPKGWTLAYRDFCVPAFERVSETSAELRFEDVADQAFESPGYLHCWHAVCLGVLDLEKSSDGRVDFEIREAERLAVARITWG
jgi:hypothetical protein